VTVSGEIRFEREVWQCGACRRSHAPVDLAISLAPKGKWTAGVERKAAYAAALSPFADAASALVELASLEMSSSEVDRIAQEHGARLDARQRREEERWRRPVSPHRKAPRPEISCEKIVIEADAANVLTVGGEEHKSVYCATVFGLDARGKSGQRPFLSQRLCTASAENMEDFAQRAKALAWRGGMRHAQAAFIGDGARCLWKWAEENLPEGTVFIQDFWHVCERLSALAQALFGEAWRERFERWKDLLRASKAHSVLRALRALAWQRAGAQREALDAEIGYLESGLHRMDYARYEREGWPVGSGAVEGACKHLIKARFSVTGARWRRKNIPQILALRVGIFNNEWDDYWKDNSRQLQKAA
jgi:hypothetical protein